ncbi:MAG: sulfatase-like hydrolase/transferase, partial [Acidobacteria bacterium]|nr:sulfatase-like hydrolase/transferase [Acidobacteriota bacterium]
HRWRKQLAESRLIPGLETVGDYVAHYDANILIADRGIGEALDRARELGLLEDALVIFTADHGESLGEHDYFFRHGRYPYNASSHVPLLIHDATRFPAGSSVAQPVELIDLYPTLRELVTPHAPPADMPGSSLVSVLLGEEGPDGIAFAESEHGKSIFLAAQSLEWKLILRLRPRRDSDLIAGQELYRLADDPLEKHNLIETQPEEFQVLRRLLGAWLADTAKGSRADSPEVDEEMRQALEALGYLD